VPRRRQPNVQDGAPFDEQHVLKRARAFDEDALTHIYQTYHEAIYRYIYRHLGDAQAAQDLASDAFRRFLQALRNGGGPNRQIGAWLYRVAHNLIVDELRRRSYRNHCSLDDTIAETLGDGEPSPEETASLSLTGARVREALHTLTVEQRQVVVLKFLEGQSNAEIAALTGKSVNAVKALQHRGLETLRAQLDRGRQQKRRAALAEQALAV
jgi:RNA polymerase sigma-70 factor (ECF subfamily)